MYSRSLSCTCLCGRFFAVVAPEFINLCASKLGAIKSSRKIKSSIPRAGPQNSCIYPAAAPPFLLNLYDYFLCLPFEAAALTTERIALVILPLFANDLAHIGRSYRKFDQCRRHPFQGFIDYNRIRGYRLMLLQSLRLIPSSLHLI